MSSMKHSWVRGSHKLSFWYGSHNNLIYRNHFVLIILPKIINIDVYHEKIYYTVILLLTTEGDINFFFQRTTITIQLYIKKNTIIYLYCYQQQQKRTIIMFSLNGSFSLFIGQHGPNYTSIVLSTHVWVRNQNSSLWSYLYACFYCLLKKPRWIEFYYFKESQYIIWRFREPYTKMKNIIFCLNLIIYLLFF